jgi:hypothetical protein
MYVLHYYRKYFRRLFRLKNKCHEQDMTGLEIFFRDFCTNWCTSRPVICVHIFNSFAFSFSHFSRMNISIVQKYQNNNNNKRYNDFCSKQISISNLFLRMFLCYHYQIFQFKELHLIFIRFWNFMFLGIWTSVEFL